MPALVRLVRRQSRLFSSPLLHTMSSTARRSSSAKATAITRFLDEHGAIRCGQRTDDGSTALLIEGDDPLGTLYFTGETATIEKVLAPVVPSQILGIGLNYRQHAMETKMPEPKFPVLFTKGVNALQHPHDPVVIPRVASDPPEVDYECELAVVLKESCCNVTQEEALAFVGGYTCANDISARRWQGKKGGGQWCRAKTFDTFCPLGPVLITPESIPNPQTLDIATYLNGEQVQKSNTSDMIFSVAEIISLLSQDCTLPKGTLILTGTPEGVGFARDPPLYLAPGDMVEVEIERIGKLVNPIVGASAL
uniref:Fumarylacetoacetase-like C-terminal domain-containing protein n=1 Tax=Peronospora matthiolae TaxID=2874970 RepID=A0AAV1U1W1_9STRA